MGSNCPDYVKYSAEIHPPTTPGGLGYMRPIEKCRTWKSLAVESLIANISSTISNPELKRLFENCYPNSLDTAVKWYNGNKAFLITGDIDAMWLRDSAAQIRPYKQFLKTDSSIQRLFAGVLNTQIDYILTAPYCNAFQAPKEAGFPAYRNGNDRVYPQYDLNSVFECKWELDSLAHFLQLSYDYYDQSGNVSWFDSKWVSAVKAIMTVAKVESTPTYGNGINRKTYRFQRQTDRATETFSNDGFGNPVNSLAEGTLIKSGFRPSDDATTFPFLIPSNAMFSQYLLKCSKIMQNLNQDMANEMYSLAQSIRQGIYKYGVVESPTFGKVFAYEVDGYGGTLIMDDANFPNLLGLPLMGFIDVDDQVYQNTRRMVLSQMGNPYYGKGKILEGVGSPHTGLGKVWPLSLAIAIQTAKTSETQNVKKWLDIILNTTNNLGLIHESINVDDPSDYTRSWFGWANGVFGETLLDVLERFPTLIKTD